MAGCPERQPVSYAISLASGVVAESDAGMLLIGLVCTGSTFAGAISRRGAHAGDRVLHGPGAMQGDVRQRGASQGATPTSLQRYQHTAQLAGIRYTLCRSMIASWSHLHSL